MLDRILRQMPGIPERMHFFVFEPRALAIQAEMIPILSAFIRVLSAFISVTGFLWRVFDWPNQKIEEGR